MAMVGYPCALEIISSWDCVCTSPAAGISFQRVVPGSAFSQPIPDHRILASIVVDSGQVFLRQLGRAKKTFAVPVAT
jgi:hypothetical protein